MCVCVCCAVRTTDRGRGSTKKDQGETSLGREMRLLTETKTENKQTSRSTKHSKQGVKKHTHTKKKNDSKCGSREQRV